MNNKFSISVLLSFFIVVSMVAVYTGISTVSGQPSRQLAVVPDGYTYNTCTLTVDDNMKIIASGSENAYNYDEGGDPPQVDYDAGDFPPYVAGENIVSGKVLAFGPGGSVAYDRPTELGIKSFYTKMVDWLDETDGENVLWYDGYDLYYGSSSCENMVDNLEAAGYTVDNTDTEPITTSMLSGYDVFILNNPTSLPASDIDNITSWVNNGGGLFLGGQSDYGGYLNDGVLNSLLDNLGAGINFVDDEAMDNVYNYGDTNYSPRIFLSDHPANQLPAHGVEMTSADPDYRDVMPGATVTIDLTFTNLGTEADNFLLDASDDADWPLDFADADNILPVSSAGEEASTDLVVSVPGIESIQVVDNIQVTVTSEENTSLTDSIEIPVATGNWIKPSEEDRQVIENSAAAKSGDPGYWMYVGSSDEGYQDERAYLKFDLENGGLPSGYGSADVDNVRLYLYAYGVGEEEKGENLQLYAVGNDSWSEESVTWSNQPATSFPSENLLGTENIMWDDHWYSWDVSSFVKNELGGDKNVTFCLRAENEEKTVPDNFSYGFYSKGSSDWGDHPYLAFGAKAWAFVTENYSGGPGDTVNVDVVVNNTGASTDSYNLTIENTSPGWSVSSSSTSINNVAPGENGSVSVSVTIPSGASWGDSEELKVTATSQADADYQISTTDFGVSVGKSLSLDLVADWNLVGMPVVNDSTTKESLFENTSVDPLMTNMLKLSGGSLTPVGLTETLQDNVGYYIKPPSAVSVTVEGASKSQDDLDLVADWNLVSLPVVDDNTSKESLFQGTGVDPLMTNMLKLSGGSLTPVGLTESLLDNVGYYIKPASGVTLSCP